MADIELSRGIIADIINGAHPEEPIVQIVSMKKVPGGVADRYRILLSDGLYSSSFAMLATQLNELVENGEVTVNCVFKLKRFIVNTVQDNKKVLIVLELEVLRSGEEVGGKIGNPEVYDPAKHGTQSSNAQQRQPPQQQQERVPLAQRPGAPAAANSPSRGTPGGGTPGQNVRPIASLTPYQNKWTICARVTRKSDVRTYSNARGDGKLFSLDLLDQSGEIRATLFNAEADKFMDLLEVNKLYYITGGQLKTANKQYSNLNNEYELTFSRMTEVVPCTESKAIPTMQFQFVTLDKINSVEKDAIVDVIGVAKAVDEVKTFTSRAGKELKKRDVSLVDSTNHEINLTLWGNTAETFDGTLQPVLAVKGAKVGDFGGRTLSVLSQSTIQINPDIKEAHELKGWFDNGGNAMDTVNLSGNRQGPAAGGFTNFKLLQSVQGDMASDEAEYFSCSGTITLMNKERAFYQACPGDGCNKKVVDMQNGMFNCEKCRKEYDNFEYRLMVSISLADCSDSVYATLFNETAEAILGASSNDIGNMSQNDPASMDTVFDKATFQDYNFRLRAKMETYNDERRRKITVMKCEPLKPVDHCKRLLQDIKQMNNLQQ